MRKNYTSRKFIKSKIILLASFLFLSVVFLSMIAHICRVRAESRIKNTEQFVASEESKIRYAIESRIITAKALEMYVLSKNGDISDFSDVAAFYYEDDPAIRSVQLAPGGVVSQENTYPREEWGTASYDLFADPEGRADVEKARDLDEIMISGPFELFQGGKGVLIRNPIYMEAENGQKTFWGFSVIIFNVPEVFNIEHLNLLTNDNYYYRLWGYLPGTEEVRVIVENTDRKLPYAAREEIEIRNVVWYLDIMPEDNWLPRSLVRLLFFVFSTILILIMIGIHSHLKIRDIVYYDRMLNIGNGNYLSKVFKKLSWSVSEEKYLAVFDIDKFKEFNYIYGEENGDKLLKYIVRVFREELPEVGIFRYYSDYFALLAECGSRSQYEAKMEKLLGRFREDIEKERIQPFDISAGVRKMEKGEPLRRIVSDALIAQGTIKGNYLKSYAFYSDAIRHMRIDYMEMESDFSKALREKEFCVYYQPKYDIRSGKIVGAEALTRWVKSDGSILSPAAFIPCFEDSRQIILLDEYVLREVCRQMKEMESDGLEVKPVSVNLSRVHLRHPDILPKISAIIKESGIEPSNISFEITESALLEESIPMENILNHLHELGCRVDMDDYGVGASTPDALLSNRFDMLKLDKSFVDRIGDGRTEDLIRSTIELAMKWGIEVLAEGVEERYQAERLVELGCTYAQGFHYSKPVTEEEYRKLLRGL